MCNEPYKPEKLLRDYPVSFKRECLQSSIKPDVMLVTKEKLYIPAHKVVLAARDKFWFSLFQDVQGCAGVCPADPFYVFLPEFDYQTVMLVIQSYYEEDVKVPKIKTEDFKSLSRHFGNSVLLSETKCRICGEKVKTQILHHLIEHVKTSAGNDKQKAIHDYTQEIRCSFTKDSVCRLEQDYDKGVFANGIFNDRYCHNTNDMIETINQHYRRHLRNEMNYLKGTGITLPGNEMEISFFHLADIGDYIAPLNEHSEHNEEMNRYVSTGDRVEGEIDDYSGGMSSPSSSSSFSEQLARPEKSDNEGRKSALECQNTGAETSHQPTCKKCNQTFKSNIGFRKHVIKELSSELEQFVLHGHNSSSVDKESNMCKVPNCKNQGKSFTNSSFLVQHMGTVHNMLEDYLKSRGQSINDWDSCSNANRRSVDAGTSGKVSRPESRNTNNSEKSPHPQSSSTNSSGKISRRESTESSTTNEEDQNNTIKKFKPAPDTETETPNVEKGGNQEEVSATAEEEAENEGDDDAMSDDMWFGFKDKLRSTATKNQDDDNMNEEKSQGSSGDKNDERRETNENEEERDELIDSESDKDTLPPVPMDTDE